MQTSGTSAKGPSASRGCSSFIPALALNSRAGALVLADPSKLENPFFLLFPEWSLLPVVILATMATIIASQAVITGRFSLTRQAIQLRLFPRLEIRHTSAAQEGQIYMPQINYLLMLGVLFRRALWFVEQARDGLWALVTARCL